ncbi:unnamed protein product [Adineta ricciae]|uniref:Endoplasmic reticulum junction formation protein lunapark n=1 Tax=Adineta ricciae TaxID=249248 RepID=A0A813PQ58_ADIRI|nr:unnamed protein product [Adineta ricciae]
MTSFFNRLFKFRIFKFRTTLSEELDDLHSELSNLQQGLIQSRLLQRQWTKWFAIYAILIYLVTNISYYTLFLSRDFVSRFYAFTLSIVLAILFYGIHWIIRWYFRMIIQAKGSNAIFLVINGDNWLHWFFLEDKLEIFKERKQELIEEVKNKETYAVAKNLLEKYGETIAPEIRSPIANGNSKDLRPRVSIKPGVPNLEKPVVSITPPKSISQENGNHPIQTPVRGGSTRLAAGVTPGKLPRAILPPQRTFWGAILDTIVGDGPSKRYALICSSCNSHNGMALDEEFEYLSFRCAYCNYLNGARKRKPVFNGNLSSPSPPAAPLPAPIQNQSAAEPMELSVTDSSDSTDQATESQVTRRSIRLSTVNHSNGNPAPNGNKRSLYPTLSSSEESLSDKKK